MKNIITEKVSFSNSKFHLFFDISPASPPLTPRTFISTIFTWTRRASWRLVETSTYFTEFLANTVQKAQIMRRGKDHNEQDTSRLRVNCQNLMFTIFLLNLSINLKFFLLHWSLTFNDQVNFCTLGMEFGRYVSSFILKTKVLVIFPKSNAPDTKIKI